MSLLLVTRMPGYISSLSLFWDLCSSLISGLEC